MKLAKYARDLSNPQNDQPLFTEPRGSLSFIIRYARQMPVDQARTMLDQWVDTNQTLANAPSLSAQYRQLLHRAAKTAARGNKKFGSRL